MSFDEWFYKQLGDRDETQQPFKIAKMWASCAWYARQQEFDKLQAEIDKLQNRIDEALRTIEPSDEITHSLYRKVYKILKGEH